MTNPRLVDDFALHGTSSNTWTHFWLSQRDYWHPVVETWDIAKPPTMHRSASTTKNDAAQAINTAEAEKP